MKFSVDDFEADTEEDRERIIPLIEVASNASLEDFAQAFQENRGL
jgi:hypothetical protein